MTTVLADRYELQTEIARGAIGIVWLGRDTVTGDAVAVKVLRAELRSEPAILETCFAEAETLSALDHPGVVAAKDFIVTDTVTALVLEHVDGPDLREHLRRHGPLAPADAARRVGAAAEALAAVHRAGLVHGDVKPGNLMLPADGGVKLVDFGIARAATRTTTPSHGTPEYTAPEVVAGRSATPAVDAYALGLVLFEALTGHSAYRGGAIAEVLDRQLAQIPVKPAGMDDTLWSVIERCLALEPDDRADLDQVAAELKRLAPSLPETPAAPTEPRLRPRTTAPAEDAPATPAAGIDTLLAAQEPEQRPNRAGTAVLAAAGVAAVIAVVALVFFALPGGPADQTDAAEPTATTAPTDRPTDDTITTDAAETAEPTTEPDPTDEPDAEPTEAASAPTAPAPATSGPDTGPTGAPEPGPTGGTDTDRVPGGEHLGSPLPGGR